MKQTEIAWCAGFFDGEGCIAPIHGSYFIRVTQKNPEALVRFQKVFNGGKLYRIQSEKSYAHHYKLYGLDAILALVSMLPYLTVKREEAIEAIKNREKIRYRAKNNSLKSNLSYNGKRLRFDSNRILEIIELRKKGKTFKAIGELYGITRQRASQLYLFGNTISELLTQDSFA